MLSGQSRFISTPSVIQQLTGSSTLPAPVNPSLAGRLGLPEETKLEEIKVVPTKGVGATQCRPYILHFSGDFKVFLKLSPGVKNAAASQKIADDNINRAMSLKTDPFILMIPNSVVIAYDKAKTNELLFFPFVSGQNLFMTTEAVRDNQEKVDSAFASIGEALAEVHITCMQQAKTYDNFLAKGCILPAVLVHDDWQSTNIMINSDFKAKIIDTEGTQFLEDGYRNIKETWEMCGKNPQTMLSFLNGYVQKFPLEYHTRLKNLLSEKLTAIGCSDIFDYKGKKPTSKLGTV